MKLKTLVIGIAFLCVSTYVSAQNKMAHINFNELVQVMPESKAAIETLQKMSGDYQAQLDKLAQEFKTKNEAFEKEKATMQGAIKDFKIKDLQDLQKKFEDFKKAANTDIQKKREDLINPIIKKAKDTIAAIAKDKGYNYVVDSGSNTYVYMNAGDDIMALAKKKLGIE